MITLKSILQYPNLKLIYIISITGGRWSIFHIFLNKKVNKRIYNKYNKNYYDDKSAVIP